MGGGLGGVREMGCGLVTGARPSPISKEGGNVGQTWVDQMEQVTVYVGSAREVQSVLEAFGVQESEQRVVEEAEDETMDVDDGR